MKKIKITKQQYETLLKNNLNESFPGASTDTKFKKEFKKVKVKNLGEMESNFKIDKPIAGISNTRMPSKTPNSAKTYKPINEDFFSPEMHDILVNILKYIWNGSPEKAKEIYDPILLEYDFSFADAIESLFRLGVLTLAGGGTYRIVNKFKRIFSKDKQKAVKEKEEEIEKIVSSIEKNPSAPWSKNSLSGPSKFDYKPKQDNSVDDTMPYMKTDYKAIGLGKEIALLNGPDGMYSYWYDDNQELQKMPNLDAEDVAIYVNANLDKISKGRGVKDYMAGVDLVKIDEPLKEKLIQLYGKDKSFTDLLYKLEEMTSAASSGAFTAPLFSRTSKNKNISKDYSPATKINDLISNEDELYSPKKKIVDEMTTASSSGSYVQPQIWAKNKANWAPAHKTQYPQGEMVDFDPCTKLNNNKSAQSGKCSQGAVDNVVKTHRTSQSVISKNIKN